MSLKGKALRGSAVLTVCEAVIYGASFVRNMILARLLTTADFGIATSLAMVVSFFEFSGKLGISRFVVQDKDGDKEDFLRAAHLVQFVAGLGSAVVFLLASWPVSRMMRLEGQLNAFALLASLPLLRAVTHLDPNRFERQLRFWPSALSELVPQVLMTALAWPLGTWLRDYRAVLALLVLKFAISCLCTHGLAERRFQMAYHRDYVKHILSFGWPLVMNGVLMFAVGQGDQFLIATFYSMSDLGPYAAAAALAIAPTFIFGKIFNSVMLPVLAMAQNDRPRFLARYRQALVCVCAFAAACAVGVILGSKSWMLLAYGSKYESSGYLLACLATAIAFRNVRIAPALAALAKGDSENQLIANLWRAVALLPAAACAWKRGPLWLVACSALVGEAFSCWVSFSRLRKRDGVPVREGIVPTFTVAGFVLAALLLERWLSTFCGPAVMGCLGVLGAILAGALMIAKSEAAKELVWNGIRGVLRRGKPAAEGAKA